MICARWIVIVVGVALLSGCASSSVSRRQFEARRQSYYRLKFDSVTSVVVVTHPSVDEAASSVWTGVVELGGTVESVRGDTLIIEPYYILQWEVTPSGALQIVRHDDKRLLPDLVLISAGPGFRMESPSDRRRPKVMPILVLLSMLLYLRFHRW